MTLPPINLKELVKLLKKDGLAELKTANPFATKLFAEYENMILILEKDVIPLLARGCEAEALLAPAAKLAKCAGHLSLMASEFLSFVPGPIGIICSLALAIACFSSGQILQGFFELLGCIPGGKVAGKSVSKLYPAVKAILIRAIENNHQLAIAIEIASNGAGNVVKFFREYGPKTKKVDVGFGYGARTSVKPNVPTSHMNPEIAARQEIMKYTLYPNTYGNMGKTNLWPHLY